MKRRERLERKLEKRQDWAETRRADAAQRFEAAHAATEHIPFGQPILRDKERIEEIKQRTERSAKAEQSGGVVVEESGEWCRITFAEKPSREVLDALKAAGFRWGGGSWGGRTADIPEIVRAEL